MDASGVMRNTDHEILYRFTDYRHWPRFYRLNRYRRRLTRLALRPCAGGDRSTAPVSMGGRPERSTLGKSFGWKSRTKIVSQKGIT